MRLYLRKYEKLDIFIVSLGTITDGANARRSNVSGALKTRVGSLWQLNDFPVANLICGGGTKKVCILRSFAIFKMTSDQL